MQDAHLAGPRRMTYHDESSVPALHWAKDQGTYLMSNREASTLPPVYALGHDPSDSNSPDWYHRTSLICGGDDFVETIPLEDLRKYLPRRLKGYLEIRVEPREFLYGYSRHLPKDFEAVGHLESQRQTKPPSKDNGQDRPQEEESEIHIGKKIEARIKEIGIQKKEFARRYGHYIGSLQPLLKSKSLDVEKLMRIGQILGYNFLSLYSDDLSEKEAGRKQDTEEEAIPSPGLVCLPVPDENGDALFDLLFS